MEKQPKRSISVCIGIEEYRKLCQIAKEESRTVSSQVFFWIRKSIRAYEHLHGAQISDIPKQKEPENSGSSQV